MYFQRKKKKKRIHPLHGFKAHLPWREHSSTKEKAHRFKAHNFPSNEFQFGSHLEALDTG